MWINPLGKWDACAVARQSVSADRGESVKSKKTQILISHIFRFLSGMLRGNRQARYHFFSSSPVSLSVTEALLLYDIGGGWTCSICMTHVSEGGGCWEKWSGVVRSSNEQMSGGDGGQRWPSFLPLPFCFLFFHLSASPFSIYTHTHVCVSVCMCASWCMVVCVCLLLAHSRSMLLIDSCGCWAAH